MVKQIRAAALTLSLALGAWSENPKWSVTVGTTEGARSVIQSSGDIYTEVPGTSQREVTGYVNREELEILGRMLADPQLHKTAPSKPTAQDRFLTFTYGEIKKTFALKQSSDLVERLSKEVDRALSAAKQ